MEYLSSMTRFDPVTPELVSRLSEVRLSYEEVSRYLAELGLSIQHAVHDPGRQILHTYYADFDRGLYCPITFTREFFEGAGRSDLLRLSHMRENGNDTLLSRDWDRYYGLCSLFSTLIADVPVPMLIYDFQKRMDQIDTNRIFDVWFGIYKRINYANGMWKDEVLERVFSLAPETEKPAHGENGLITVYRGMGELSQKPETALSWSSHPASAMYFANHSGRGTHFAIADVVPQDIIAYFPGYWNENEVLVRPGTARNIRYADMLPAEEETFVKLTVPALPEFISFGKQAGRFGYKEEEDILEFHGLKHILRVLFLSLIYFYGSGDALTEGDKSILIYFSLLHDAGRTDEDEDGSHGAASLIRIKAEGLRVGGLRLTKKEYRIARLIIEYHCRDDEEGIRAIHGQPDFSKKDKERAVMLYRTCKDMDGLDRVRFNGLDYRLLRTAFARRLPLIAGCLLTENICAVVDKGDNIAKTKEDAI